MEIEQPTVGFKISNIPVGMREVWQVLVVCMLCVGLIGFNFTRIFNMTLTSRNITNSEAGYVSTVGGFAYAMGKFANAPFADWLGGKTVFIYCLTISSFMNLCLSISGDWIYSAVVNGINMFFSAAAWGSMTSVMRVWIEDTRSGKAFAAVSISNECGGFVTSILLGVLLSMELVGWQGMYWVSCTISTAIMLFLLVFLPGKPQRPSLEPPRSIAIEILNNISTEGAEIQAGTEPKDINHSAIQFIFKYMLSLNFWMVTGLTGAMTMGAEFALFLPLLLYQTLPLSKGESNIIAGLFNIGSVIGLIFGGLLIDWLSQLHKSVMLVSFTFTACVCTGLLLLAVIAQSSYVIPIICVIIFVQGFASSTPYYLPSSIYSTKYGGLKDCAKLAGWFDGFGYVVSIGMDLTAGIVSDYYGWNPVIGFLTCCYGFGTLCVLVNEIAENRSIPHAVTLEIIEEQISVDTIGIKEIELTTIDSDSSETTEPIESTLEHPVDLVAIQTDSESESTDCISQVGELKVHPNQHEIERHSLGEEEGNTTDNGQPLPDTFP